ncbi:hypothetical protein ACJROX_03900 [Pseudalkalibacillus sp. A8]
MSSRFSGEVTYLGGMNAVQTQCNDINGTFMTATNGLIIRAVQ